MTAGTLALGPAFWERRRRALRNVAPVAGLVVLPALLWVFALRIAVADGNLAADFHYFFYAHGQDVLAGRTPPGAYPALTSVLLAPLALLPHDVADVVFTLVLLACAAGTLWVLGVRDWRCYGAATLWYPVFSAVQTGNLSLLLALGVALLWRWRDRPLAAGAVAAGLVALKLFLWPLLVWLAATRRWRALAVTAIAGSVASAAAWSVLGFGALEAFPQALRTQVRIDGHRAYTVAASLADIGASDAVAYTVSAMLGLGVLAAAVVLRGRQAVSLSLAIGAALLLSPIIWAHYLSLLLVPVALARPRFSWLWLAPLPLWLCPPVDGAAWQKLLLLAVAGVMLVQVARTSPPLSSSRARSA